MSYRDYQRRQHCNDAPQRRYERYTIIEVEEVDDNCQEREGEWVNNPILYHRTSEENLQLIERDGYLDPEVCTMKDALCKHCSWGVCFSVEAPSRVHGPHILSGRQLEVLEGSWFCYALRREEGYEYGGAIYPKPYVTVLFSRESSAPCRHYSKERARNYVQFIRGRRCFNIGHYAFNVIVQEPVSLSVLDLQEGRVRHC